DLPGSNWVIFFDEFMFLPAYGLALLAGIHGDAALLSGLIGADVLTDVFAWARLTRRGFFEGVAAPSLKLAREICGYGLRGQVGGVVLLVNLRLDFIILDLIAGPSVLGVYAVAS